MDEDVTAAVAVENELAGSPHVVWIAEIDHDVAGAIEDYHGVIGRQAGDNRPADRTRAASYDRDAAVIVGFA
jgi:hypothetical protein